ncbi:MAG: glycerol acyltransferase [Anaerolineae bacterium]|nr:hypothetical protein [Thermoflexales bacterium]MDW8406403.1 glycerol acyltransferase [Anaerolineae bacterium]
MARPQAEIGLNPHMGGQNSAFEELVRINTNDFITAIGLEHLKRGRGILTALLRPLAVRFAKQVLMFDEIVATRGLPAAGEWVTREFAAGYTVLGWREELRNGPVLFVSNHPGLTDALALFAAIDRNDLAIIARHRDFLHAIPNIARYLIYVSDEGSDRSLAIRAVRDHLRAGRAVLLFPAGKIEPDPLALPGAAEALSEWSSSIGLIARLVPEALIAPVIVSGVLSRAALRNPITRIRKQKKDREWLAATLQVIVPAYQHVQVHLNFGAPVPAGELVRHYGDAIAVTQAVVARARALLPPEPLNR